MRIDLAEIGDRLWSDPDPLLSAAGMTGEFLVSKIRLVLTGVLLLIPVMDTVLGADPREMHVGLTLTGTAFILSIAAYVLVRRGFGHSWLGFGTGSLDVTLVSAGLAV